MADIALVAAEIRMVYPDHRSEVYTVKLAEAVTKGLILYWTTAGTVGIADGNVAEKDEPCGVALEAGSAGSFISMLTRGCVEGFTIVVNTGVKCTLTDDPGELEEAGAGEYCGTVVAVPDGTYVIFFDFELAQAGVG